jgi:hypothetical protein
VRRILFVVVILIIAGAIFVSKDKEQATPTIPAEPDKIMWETTCTDPNLNPCTDRYWESDGSEVTITTTCQPSNTLFVTIKGIGLGTGNYGITQYAPFKLQAGAISDGWIFPRPQDVTMYLIATDWNLGNRWRPFDEGKQRADAYRC